MKESKVARTKEQKAANIRDKYLNTIVILCLCAAAITVYLSIYISVLIIAFYVEIGIAGIVLILTIGIDIYLREKIDKFNLLLGLACIAAIIGCIVLTMCI